MTTPQLLWPPPLEDTLAKANAEQTERVDLLGLIPPNRFDDYSVPNREQEVAGVILRADRVIMDRVTYPDCDRSTQHKLSDHIQASCREQGYCISVKEWADKNQHRGTLRLRLRCRSSACRFQFQLNWDSKAGFWYISRRRCGTFVHTCKPVKGDESLTPTQEGNKRKLQDGKGSGSKRARLSPEGSPSGSNANNKTGGSDGKNTSAGSNGRTAKAETNGAAVNGNSQENNSKALEQALDSARSLLDLSRAPSGGSVSGDQEGSSPTSPTSQATSPMSQAPSYMPLQLGDRVFFQNINPAQLSLLSGAERNLSAHQKLSLLQDHDLGANGNLMGHNAVLSGFSPDLKASMQQRCMAYPKSLSQGQSAQALLQQVDPRLLHNGFMMNGGVVKL